MPAGPLSYSAGMANCCSVHPVRDDQRRVLGVVLAVNLVMFAVEMGVGLLAQSTSLLADSVDMLGDALVYGFSLYAVGREQAWQTRAAVLKGAIMATFAAGVAAEVVVKLALGVVPAADLMWGVALLALAANACVLALLARHRGADLNMRSAWLCSRNDVIANTGVLAAAAGVSATGSAWPDVLVGLAIAALFAHSAVLVLRQAVAVPRAAVAGGR